MKNPHSIKMKCQGLVPTQYTVGELADETGIPNSTLRGWLKAGAPHQLDEEGKIVINGKTFLEWVENQSKPKQGKKLEEGFAYCFHCKDSVKFVDPTNHPAVGRLYHIKATCPNCGNKITRGASYGKNNLPG